MKNFDSSLFRLAKSAAFVSLCSTVLSACSSDQVSTQESVSKDTYAWQSLVQEDGLDGWRQLGGQAPYVLDGEIITGTVIDSDKNSFLATEALYSDFIFEVDVRADPGINSGIQFRSNSLPSYRNGRVHGYQMEIDTSARKWSGGIFDEAGRGWLYTLTRNKACQDAFLLGEWNKYRIEAKGSHIRTFVNGVPCANLIDTASSKGFIALQVHSAKSELAGKTIQWRKPRIMSSGLDEHFTELAANTPVQFSQLNNTLSEGEKERDWNLLWDGAGSDGLSLPEGWSVSNGEIIAKASADQKTQIHFDVAQQNFELEVDVSVSDSSSGEMIYLAINAEGEFGSILPLIDDKSHPDAKDPKKSFGALLDKVAPGNLSEANRKTKRMNKGDAWNRIRIVVNGPKGQHWINNNLAAKVRVDQSQMNPSSKLIFTVKEGTIKLKNIKLRQLVKNPGDRVGHVMEEVVPRDVIPPAPILGIDEALASFELHPDFELQVVAKEPMIFDPIVTLYDEAGRLWAVEMTTYMPNAKGEGEMKHESQIVVLSDTDNDGEMDARHVVLEKLVLPRALTFVPNGILWADMEKLYFSELEEKDGNPIHIKTEVVDPVYSKKATLEHKANGLLFSLDNWYYSAMSNDKYRPYPLDAKLPAHAEEIYRNKFWKMARSYSIKRQQWGIAQDDYGRHYFLGNSTPILTTSRIPLPIDTTVNYKISEKVKTPVGTKDIYPIRVTPAINRGYSEDAYSEGYKLKSNTAAAGALVYRGSQYADEYYGMAIYSEPTGHLVKATRVIEKDGVITGENFFDKRELLASTDERFRPVNAVNAPDGTISVVDFYHGIIQHRTFMTSYLEEQIKMRDLERHKHIGRVYRIKHKGAEIPKVEYLDNLSAESLIPFLGHENGWHRDMAHQQLVMKQDVSVVPELKNLASSSTNPLAQIKALWVLEGLGVVDFEVLVSAAKSNDIKVKRSVYRLVTLLPENTDVSALSAWLSDQSSMANAELAPNLQLAAATFGLWSTLTDLILAHGAGDHAYVGIGLKADEYLASNVDRLPSAVVEQIRSLSHSGEGEGPSLAGAEKESFDRGEALYFGKASCFACHGDQGDGNSMIPPLNNSEWVTGSKPQLVGILLHGLTGPITVNGKEYSGAMAMPGLAQNPAFSDQDIADISTYIRNAWTNNADPVSASEVTALRKSTANQASAYTVETLKSKLD